MNWDEELFETLDNLRNTSTNEEFNNVILELIESAGEMEVPTTNPPEELPDELSFNLDFEWIDDNALSETVKSELKKIQEWFRPQENHYVFISGFTPDFGNDSQFFDLDYSQNPEENVRILALFRYWNIIKHFNPYNEILDQDWDSTLVQFIPEFINAQNVVYYNKAILKLQTNLNDTHAFASGRIINNQIQGMYYLPLEVSFVENETVIRRVLSSYPSSLKPGDIVKSIDGVNITEIRDSLRKIARASNPSVREHIINGLLIRSLKHSFVSVSIMNESGEKDTNLTTVTSDKYFEMYNYTEKEIWKIINTSKASFGYIDMGRLENEQIDDMIDDLWETDAWIFDVRNYPNGTMFELVRYLYDAPIQSADDTNPDVRYPGTFFWKDITIGEGDFSRTYRKPVIILFNEKTISHAEYTAMSFEQHPKSIKIGSQTAGADGDITWVELPAGVTLAFTSLGWYYPDRSPTQRIGIVPDIEIHPTIQGIREGRDEVLEVALQQIVTSIEDENKSYSFALSQNYPNPFNPTTQIEYELAENSLVDIRIYDVLGNLVKILEESRKLAGKHRIIFDGTELSSGIYFYKLTAENFSQTRKMLLLK